MIDTGHKINRIHCLGKFPCVCAEGIVASGVAWDNKSDMYKFMCKNCHRVYMVGTMGGKLYLFSSPQNSSAE